MLLNKCAATIGSLVATTANSSGQLKEACWSSASWGYTWVVQVSFQVRNKLAHLFSLRSFSFDFDFGVWREICTTCGLPLRLSSLQQQVSHKRHQLTKLCSSIREKGSLLVWRSNEAVPSSSTSSPSSSLNPSIFFIQLRWVRTLSQVLSAREKNN